MIEAWVREVLWRGRGGWKGTTTRTALVPLEMMTRVVVAARNAYYDRLGSREAELPVPVLSVGNLSVGGTGKTPLLKWIGEHPLMEGLDQAVVTRGYGEDEVALYRSWFGASRVFVGADRWSSVRTAAAQGVDAILLDDGFQHRRLPRHMDLVLIAAEDSWPLRLLPRGPFRESMRSLHRASIVALTSRAASEAQIARWTSQIGDVVPALPLSRLEFRLSRWVDLEGRDVDPPTGEVLALCSIGNPEAFSEMVGAAVGEAPDLMAFPDHHSYAEADLNRVLERARGRPIVTTEKDAVKIRRFRLVDSPFSVVLMELAVQEHDPILDVLSSFARLARTWPRPHRT